jgi:hypothetical protein
MRKTRFPVVMMAATSAAVQAQQRPNIVLFMVNDMGWGKSCPWPDEQP